MKKILAGILLALAMVVGASAVEPAVPSWLGEGWAGCNANGNYGGWDKVSPCYVAWDGVTQACNNENKDAFFTVGADGMITTGIQIVHLDGIADTSDSFQILNGDQVLCNFSDDGPRETEDWMILNCDGLNLYSINTLRFHPTAVAPWNNGQGLTCDIWGQVAVSDITFTTEETNPDVPEFTVIGAAVLLGVIGLFILKRR